MVLMRIAIVKLSALGDIVHAMAALQFIKQLDRDIMIDWIVEENYKELLCFNPDINNVHIVNLKEAKREFSLNLLLEDFRRLHKLQVYDLVIDMQGLIKSAIISRIIPSKVTLGFDRMSVKEGVASFFYSKTFNINYDENVVKRNFELIKFALTLPSNFNDLHNKTPFLFSGKKYIQSHLSMSKKNIVLIPGASHPSKQYPVHKFIELTKMLDANFIIIWGNHFEKKLAYEISFDSPNVNVSNRVSLSELISLLSKIDLVIGGDTGPTHLAWGLNIPSIMLFGSTPGYRNTLTSKKNLIIESKSLVNPNTINKKDFSIQEIKVTEVLEAASRLLKI